ncbi:MAG: hypothetical protein Tsb0034_30470 [Ekhidna sp.]
MEKVHTEIIPGVGLGKLKFGMSREEVKAILGEPNHQQITDYGDEESDQNDAWEYHPLRLDMSFEEAENWKLTIISISSEDYHLKGSSLIGLNMEELLEELEVLGFDELEIEDTSSAENPDQMLVSSEDQGINFWVNEDIVEEIQWGPIFTNDNTIQWPE